MLRSAMHSVGMADRVELLRAVARFEDEDKLAAWEYEYRLPRYSKEYFWDEALVERFCSRGDKGSYSFQQQRLIYNHLEDILSQLLVYVYRDEMASNAELATPQRYAAALDTINAYSTREDDVFLPLRIMAHVRKAEAFLANTQDEEGLKELVTATNLIGLLWNIPIRHPMHGSGVVLTVCFCKPLSAKDVLENCIGNIANPRQCPLYERVVNDDRFLSYEKAVNNFFDIPEKGQLFHQVGEDCMDPTWEQLLKTAKRAASELEDSCVATMLMANGDLTLPPISFREAIVSVEKSNKDTLMLLKGLNSYITKTVSDTMA